MRLFIALLVGSLISLLSGCATSYQPDGLTGGYSDIQLNQNTYSVSFRGNEYTSHEVVQKYLLYRAAQLTLQKGENYFIVLNSTQNIKKRYFSTPGYITQNGNANYYGFGSFGNANYTTNSVIVPPEYSESHSYRDTMIIKLLSDNKDFPNAYEARVILSSISIK